MATSGAMLNKYRVDDLDNSTTLVEHIILMTIFDVAILLNTLTVTFYLSLTVLPQYLSACSLSQSAPHTANFFKRTPRRKLSAYGNFVHACVSNASKNKLINKKRAKKVPKNLPTTCNSFSKKCVALLVRDQSADRYLPHLTFKKNRADTADIFVSRIVVQQHQKMSKVTYTPRKEGDVHIDSLMWAITNPTTVFDNNSRSSNHLFPENNDDLINQAGDLAWFRLKINVDSDKNVSIHYQCNSKQSPHVPIFMKYNLWNCQRNGTKTECKESIAKQVCTVQSGLWHLAATEPQVNLIKFASELCLRFDFKIIYDIQSVEGKAPEGLSCNDYESFLDNEAFSDVTITSVDRQEFHAHRIVLASRSPVFKALFQHKTTESKTNVIESPFVSYVLKEVLRFMYSDKAPKIDEIPEKLLTAADYYQVLQLKRLCEKELILKLTVENVVETLQLADMHSADALKLLALDFINDGPKKLLTKSAAWAKLKSPELIKEIYEYDLD